MAAAISTNGSISSRARPVGAAARKVASSPSSRNSVPNDSALTDIMYQIFAGPGSGARTTSSASAAPSFHDPPMRRPIRNSKAEVRAASSNTSRCQANASVPSTRGNSTSATWLIGRNLPPSASLAKFQPTVGSMGFPAWSRAVTTWSARTGPEPEKKMMRWSSWRTSNAAPRLLAYTQKVRIHRPRMAHQSFVPRAQATGLYVISYPGGHAP